MAHNPQAPQGPEGNNDPAGSTQMFRAFVDEAVPQGAQQPAAPQGQAGPRIGVIVAVVAVVVVLIGIGALAL